MHILFAAHEAGPANHIIRLISLIHSRNIDISIICSEITKKYFLSFEKQCQYFFSCQLPRDKTKSSDLSPLFAYIKNCIQTISPTHAIVGSSAQGYGIDEVIIEYGSNCHIKVSCFQDYWGDVNKNLTSFPDIFFVLDDFAKKITIERVPPHVKVIVSGSTVNNNYDFFDVSKYCLSFGDISTIVFIGQPLHDIAGYFESIWLFEQALRSFLPKNVKYLYKLHPREKEAEVVEYFISYKISMQILNRQGSKEEIFLHSDLLCTIYSTLSIDFLEFNSRSISPLCNFVHLFFNSNLVAFFKQETGLRSIPLCESKVFPIITKSEGLALQLKNLIHDMDSRYYYWRRQKDSASTIFSKDNNAIVDYIINT